MGPVIWRFAWPPRVKDAPTLLLTVLVRTSKPEVELICELLSRITGPPQVFGPPMFCERAVRDAAIEIDAIQMEGFVSDDDARRHRAAVGAEIDSQDPNHSRHKPRRR